jgi:hypothetical protein
VIPAAQFGENSLENYRNCAAGIRTARELLATNLAKKSLYFKRIRRIPRKQALTLLIPAAHFSTNPQHLKRKL